MSEEDKELEMLKAKRLAEMQKNFSEQDQLNDNTNNETEKPKPTLRDYVVNSLGHRGMEVLQNAEYQFPNESKIIIEKLGELISTGDINETLDGGKLWFYSDLSELVSEWKIKSMLRKMENSFQLQINLKKQQMTMNYDILYTN